MFDWTNGLFWPGQGPTQGSSFASTCHRKLLDLSLVVLSDLKWPGVTLSAYWSVVWGEGSPISAYLFRS